AVHNKVITSTEFFRENGGPLNVGDIVLKWERLKVQMAFELPDNTVHAGDTTVILIPPQLKFGDVSGFPIKDAGGNLVANAVIDAAAGTITLTYTDYPEHHSGVKGKFFFFVRINHLEYDTEQDIPIEIKVGSEVFQGPTVHFPGVEDAEAKTFVKNSWKGGDAQISYSININQKKQAIRNVVVTDAIQTPGVTIDKNSFRVYKGTWYLRKHEWILDQTAANDVTSQFINQVAWSQNAEGKATGFTLPIGDIGSDDGYVIRFDANINYQPVNGEKFENDATLSGSEIQPITVHSGMHYAIGGGIAEGYVFKIHIVKTDDSIPPLPVEGAKFTIVRKS
ncbi:MAG: Ig-like domain-containing protein, partial [Eubacteriales bacterium]|nr:Ig-like domain-containing protein [Eubacteriales bacterium]